MVGCVDFASHSVGNTFVARQLYTLSPNSIALAAVRADRNYSSRDAREITNLCRCIAHHIHLVDVHVPAGFLLQIVLIVDARQLCKSRVNLLASEIE